MTKELLLLYKKLFFTLPNTTPSLNMYAIVDTARNPSLQEKVMLSGLDYVDLWHEEMFELDAERPLYLIHMQKDNALIELLLSQQKQSVATYLISPYELETLQMYYRNFTYVQIEEEGKYEGAIFGYYDPNVLPTYMQTLYNQEKIDEFFAGVAMWLMPSVTQEELLYIAYKNKKEQIEDVTLNLNLFLQEEEATLNFNDLYFPNQSNLAPSIDEIIIDYTQMQRFDALQKERFVKTSLQMYQTQGYREIETNQTSIDKSMVLIYEAMEAGIEKDIGLQRYMLLGLLLGKSLKGYAFYKEIVYAPMQEKKIEILEQLLWKLEKQRRAHDKQ